MAETRESRNPDGFENVCYSHRYLKLHTPSHPRFLCYFFHDQFADREASKIQIPGFGYLRLAMGELIDQHSAIPYHDEQNREWILLAA